MFFFNIIVSNDVALKWGSVASMTRDLWVEKRAVVSFGAKLHFRDIIVIEQCNIVQIQVLDIHVDILFVVLNYFISRGGNRQKRTPGHDERDQPRLAGSLRPHE